MNIAISILRIILMAVSIIFFGFFILPMMINIINIGNIAGALLCIWVFCVSCKPLHAIIKNACQASRFTVFMYRFVNVCFIAFAVYGLIITCAMTVAANIKPVDNSTVIVLGAQVRPTGEPSVILRGRLNVAREYLEANPQAGAVLSGGQGYDEPTTEAECMYKAMTEYGISAERLFTEDKSTTTEENLRFSYEIIEKNKDLSSDIVIATDGFHQLRARIIAWKQVIKGNVGAISSDTRLDLLPTYVVREWFGIPYQILLK